MPYRKIISLYKSLSLRIKLYVVLRMFVVDMQKILDCFPGSPHRVEELACGYGIASFMIAGKYKSCSISAYDVNRKRIESLVSINPFKNLEFIYKNVLEIEQFRGDVILMMDLMHHLSFQEQEQLLKRIRSTARKGATIIIKDVNKGKYSFRHLVNYLIDIMHTGEARFYYRTKLEFMELFTSSGFEIKNILHINRIYVPLNHVVFLLKNT